MSDAAGSNGPRRREFSANPQLPFGSDSSQAGPDVQPSPAIRSSAPKKSKSLMQFLTTVGEMRLQRSWSVLVPHSEQAQAVEDLLQQLPAGERGARAVGSRDEVFRQDFDPSVSLLRARDTMWIILGKQMPTMAPNERAPEYAENLTKWLRDNLKKRRDDFDRETAAIDAQYASMMARNRAFAFAAANNERMRSNASRQSNAQALPLSSSAPVAAENSSLFGPALPTNAPPPAPIPSVTPSEIRQSALAADAVLPVKPEDAKDMPSLENPFIPPPASASVASAVRTSTAAETQQAGYTLNQLALDVQSYLAAFKPESEKAGANPHHPYWYAMTDPSFVQFRENIRKLQWRGVRPDKRHLGVLVPGGPLTVPWAARTLFFWYLLTKFKEAPDVALLKVWTNMTENYQFTDDTKEFICSYECADAEMKKGKHGFTQGDEMRDRLVQLYAQLERDIAAKKASGQLLPLAGSMKGESPATRITLDELVRQLKPYLTGFEKDPANPSSYNQYAIGYKEFKDTVHRMQENGEIDTVPEVTEPWGVKILLWCLSLGTFHSTSDGDLLKTWDSIDKEHGLSPNYRDVVGSKACAHADKTLGTSQRRRLMYLWNARAAKPKPSAAAAQDPPFPKGSKASPDSTTPIAPPASPSIAPAEPPPLPPPSRTSQSRMLPHASSTGIEWLALIVGWNE